VWEALAPRRRFDARRALRWPTSLTLASVNGLLATVPMTAVALASVASERGWGALNAAGAPPWLAVAVSVPLLDLLVYAQHRLLHESPALWSFHRVHHADLFDAATALRFHPFEALATHATVLVAIVAFGLPVPGVLAYHVIAMGMTLFEHANGRLPAGLESRLQEVLVTPEMHRIHHSIAAEDAGSNFATIFSVWDRWFGTYRPRPARSQDADDVGVEELRDPKYATLPWTLALPLLGRRGLAAAVSGSDRR